MSYTCDRWPDHDLGGLRVSGWRASGGEHRRCDPFRCVASPASRKGGFLIFLPRPIHARSGDEAEFEM